MANLDSYTAVKTGLFVRLQIDQYRTTLGGSYTSQVLRFSDYDTSVTIGGEVYTPLGKLLGISQSTDELRPTNDTVSVTLSGVPTNAIAEIVNSKIKAAPIKIYRGYFTVAGTLIDSFEVRFQGNVNNYSIQEEFDVEERSASNLLILECSNGVGVLEQKLSGRKTNSKSQKSFYSSDTSMDRVLTLQGTKFDFGAPQ